MFELLFLDNKPMAFYGLKGVELRVLPELPAPHSVVSATMLGLLAAEISFEEPILQPDEDYGDETVYFPSPELLSRIGELTRSSRFDVVVIGNNMGAGLAKAKFVAEAMRLKTIIVSFGSGYVREGAYQALGYRHFATRQNMSGKLMEVLNL